MKLSKNNLAYLYLARFALIGVLCALATAGCQQGTSPTAAPASPWASGSPSTSGSQQQMDMMADMWRRQNASATAMQQQQMQHLNDLHLQQQQLARVTEERKAQDLDRQAQLSLARKGDLGEMEEMRRRAMDLDTNNRDLHTQLAQSQQETRLLEDQIQLLNKRLSSAANQLSVALRSPRGLEEEDRRAGGIHTPPRQRHDPSQQQHGGDADRHLDSRCVGAAGW